MSGITFEQQVQLANALIVRIEDLEFDGNDDFIVGSYSHWFINELERRKSLNTSINQYLTQLNVALPKINWSSPQQYRDILNMLGHIHDYLSNKDTGDAVVLNSIIEKIVGENDLCQLGNFEEFDEKNIKPQFTLAVALLNSLRYYGQKGLELQPSYAPDFLKAIASAGTIDGYIDSYTKDIKSLSRPEKWQDDTEMREHVATLPDLLYQYSEASKTTHLRDIQMTRYWLTWWETKMKKLWDENLSRRARSAVKGLTLPT